MSDVRRAFRRFVESALPWFDRDEEERQRKAFELERKASLVVRQHAQATMIREAYRDYGRRVNGG